MANCKHTLTQFLRGKGLTWAVLRHRPGRGGTLSRTCPSARQRFAMLELKAALCAILGNFVLEAANKREDIVMITEIIISIYLLATRFFLQNK
jgi:hypothetical protein